MKKVTVYLNDETANIIEALAQSYDYHKYPLYQAYGLIIDEIVSELNRLVTVPIAPRCAYIVAKSISPEDVCFCCADLKRVVAESEYGSLIAVYERYNLGLGEHSVECPYCHTRLALNEEGMIVGIAKEE